MKTADVAGSDISGADSGFTLHICNHHNECCLTDPYQDIGVWETENQDVTSGHSCEGLLLSKHPDQIPTVRLEHFGTDATSLYKFTLKMGNDFEFWCYKEGGGTCCIDVPGPNNSAIANCGVYFTIPP